MPALTTRYSRRKLVLFDLEGTYGVDAVPTAGANAIEVRNVRLAPMKNKMVEQNVERSSMGHQKQIPVGTMVQLSFDIAIAGSGAAGTAPAYGKLLRGAGHSENILAAAHANTAPAGGASTITLANTASAIDNAYRYMTIRLTGGTGAGQSRVIRSYNGTTKVATVTEAWTTPPDATTTYSLDQQVVYAPISNDFEAGTFYVNYDRVQHKLLGSRGDLDFALVGATASVYSLSFTALYGGVADVPIVAGTYTPWQDPLPVNNANTGGFRLHGFATNLYSISMKRGNQVEHRDDVVGTEDVIITDRKPGGEVVIQAPLQAEKDFYTIAKNATLGAVSVLHGTTAGHKVKFDAPCVQVEDPDYDDRRGVTALKMGLRYVPLDGDDEYTISVQ